MLHIIQVAVVTNYDLSETEGGLQPETRLLVNLK
jgi:hypothetical protein